MILKYPRYTDDEVRVFHPFFAECAHQAIKNMQLEGELRVVHHRSFNGITVDFSIERIKSNRIVLLVEVKRTRSALESTRFRHQALSYRKEADHLCETPYYILTNIENTDLFRYDANKPRVSSQLIKGSPFNCGGFNEVPIDNFIELYIKTIQTIINIAIKDEGEYDQNLDYLYGYLQDKLENYETWHASLMPFSYEYIRGAAINYAQLNNKIKSLNWKAADSYLSTPLRLSEKGRQVDFLHIFKEPSPQSYDTISFQQALLDCAYSNGKTRGKGDDVSEVIYDILAPRGSGIVETDQELASLLSVLSKIELNRPLKSDEVVCDPAAGSGRLLTAAACSAYPELVANRIWANEVEAYFSEALSLRLGLHFADTISIENCPKVTINDIATLTKENFKNVKIALINPPYISGIYSKDKRTQICNAIQNLSGEISKTNVGQIGLEVPFLELLVNLTFDDTIIAAIMPFSLLTRKSKEIQLFRKFLLEDFGLTTICCYPREGLFGSVIKRTCIFVGRKNAKNPNIKWIDINSPIERLDLNEMQKTSNGNQRIFEIINVTSEELEKSIKTGWGNNIKKTVQNWFNLCFSEKTVLISKGFSNIKRGTSGNSGSSDLAAISKQKYPHLIKMIPKVNQLPAINNSEGLEKFLTETNAPCISPILVSNEDNNFANKLVNTYISIKENEKKTSKQTKAPITNQKVMRSLEKDVCMFPKWSVLIPRSVRVSGNIAILKTTYNVSTNFIVVNCQDKRSAVLTASWLFSIFGQLQMEFLCNDQEGARKLEKNEISKLLIPQNLDEISENDFTEIYNAFKESEPINYRNINLREIDKVWSSIMLLETKDVHLQSAMNYLQDLVDERSP